MGQLETHSLNELKHLHNTTHDSCEKASALNELSFRKLRTEPTEAFRLAKKALALSQTSKCAAAEGSAYNRIGAAYRLVGNYDSAQFSYEQCLTVRKKLGDSIGIYGVLKNIGDLWAKKRFYSKSIDLYEQAGQYAGNLTQRVQLHNSISSSYRRMGDFLNARKAIENSLQLLASAGFPPTLTADTYLCYTNLYNNEGGYRKALYYGNQALNLYDSANHKNGVTQTALALGNSYFHLGMLDSSIQLYKQFYTHKWRSRDTTAALQALLNMGQAYAHSGQSDSALICYNQVIAQSGHLSDPSLHFLVNEKMGDFYQDRNQLDRAIPHYSKADEISDQIENHAYLFDFLSDYSAALRKAKRYKESSAVYSRYVALQRKIDDNRQKAHEYETSLHEAKALVADEQRKLSEQKAANRLMQTYIVAGVAVILLLGLFLIYQREKYRRALAKKEIDELLKKQELKSIVNVLEIQEQERRRIAQDLHDRLGGMLATMQYLFHDVQTSIEEVQLKSKDTYKRALNILDNAGDEVRKVAHNLVSGALKNFGLEAALKELASTIQQSRSVNFQFISQGLSDRLSTTYESHLYRVVQEMVSNTLKHAKASEITLQLLRDNGRLNLLYEDNGVGFDPNRAKEGMGLKSIASRVEKLNGHFEIDSGKGAGTTYNITIPLKTDQS